MVVNRPSPRITWANAPGAWMLKTMIGRWFSRDLSVMDASAISLSRENHLPIIVFNIHAPGAFAQVMRGEGRFTTITEAR